jgi:hypothetical protein
MISLPPLPPITHYPTAMDDIGPGGAADGLASVGAYDGRLQPVTRDRWGSVAAGAAGAAVALEAVLAVLPVALAPAAPQAGLWVAPPVAAEAQAMAQPH